MIHAPQRLNVLHSLGKIRIVLVMSARVAGTHVLDVRSPTLTAVEASRMARSASRPRLLSGLSGNHYSTAPRQLVTDAVEKGFVIFGEQ
jgi:hypothetical protein